MCAGILYAAEAPDYPASGIVRSITMSGVVSQIGVVPKPLRGACGPRGSKFRAPHIYIRLPGERCCI